jgi:hypothetical protein
MECHPDKYGGGFCEPAAKLFLLFVCDEFVWPSVSFTIAGFSI